MTRQDEQTQVTRLLEKIEDTPGTLDKLVDLVYDDIHRLAHFQRFDLSAGETLRTTALVNEAFLKVFKGNDHNLRDRQHLMRVMARAIRQIIVDHARKKLAQKRGSGVVHEPLENHQIAATDHEAARVLDIEAALEHLERLDPELADTVSARFFAGYSVSQIAEIKDVSTRTIYRDLQRATAWLRLDLEKG